MVFLFCLNGLGVSISAIGTCSSWVGSDLANNIMDKKNFSLLNSSFVHIHVSMYKPTSLRLDPKLLILFLSSDTY